MEDRFNYGISREEYRLINLIRSQQFGRVEVTIVNNKLVRAQIITNILLNKPIEVDLSDTNEENKKPS